MGKAISDLRVIFFSLSDPYGLCSSYRRAADAMGLRYQFFDYEKVLTRYTPLGKVGRKIAQHIHVDSVNHKLNREFVVSVKDYKPDAIFFFTNAPVASGALIFIKSILPECRLILVWPDSLLNIQWGTFNNLSLFDGIASYSSSFLPVLQKITSSKAMFIPLAGDLALHGMEPTSADKVDIGFVGGWRPERQKRLELLCEVFPESRFEIHGVRWKENCSKSNLKSKIKGTGLHGPVMAQFFNSTTLNLNIIDDTNYPAANMRFFEIPAAGGLELVSSCPEMESYFIDGQDLFYFQTDDEMIEKAKLIFHQPELQMPVKWNGYTKIKEQHHYGIRLQTILNQWI